MRTLIVIKLHAISNSRTEFTNVFRRVEIYVLLLDAAPEAFYPYTVIYHDEKKFMTSKSSKWQRGRRIVSYLTEVLRATQIQ